MVEPTLFNDVMMHLHKHSRRPRTAMLLWPRLFAHLPYNSNEVKADRAQLARMLEVEPRVISEIMSELENVGAVYRRREGSRVRYFVHPTFGTHLTGPARDRAQSEAPPLKLRLVEPEPAP